MSDEHKPAGDEPKQEKTRKNTKKRGLTRKEAKLAEAYITKTDNISEAGRIAGYCDAQEAHRAFKRVQRKMPDLLDAHGLTEDHVIEECLKPSLKAMETRFFANKGVVLDQREVIAWGPRQQAEERYWKLRGRLKQVDDAATAHPAGTHSVCVVVTDERRAAALARLLAPGGPAGVVIDVDAPVDEDLGREGHGEPVQATP